MKKLFVVLYLAIGVLHLGGLFSGRSNVVFADTSQQGLIPVTVELTSYFDPSNIITTSIDDVTYGDIVAFDTNLANQPSGEITYSFLFWEVNGTLRQAPIDHEFIVTGVNSLKAVFSPSNRHVVAFVDTNGMILKLQYVADQAAATPPAQPNKIGYAFSGWNVSTASVSTDLIVRATYEKTNPSSYQVIVSNGTGGGVDFAFNQVASIAADPAPEGMVFHHWTVDGKIVSYQANQTFTVLENSEWVAVYAATAPAVAPRIFVSENLGLRTSEFKRTYVGRLAISSNYTVVETGLLTHPDEVSNLTIDMAGSSRKISKIQTVDTREFMMSLTVGQAQTVRGYVIVKNAGGTLQTIYDESIYQVANGGFETGDLTGWTPYQLWKDESALAAFRTERVVMTKLYGSAGNNPYDSKGDYLFGVYTTPYDNTNKDLNQERMGMLRSSDFILSGSGFISFQLGGGKNTSTAYLSVRDAESDHEIARYGNRHFGTTESSIAIATAQYGSSIANAEAFLFQYYADLSAHVGKTLYLVLVDAASHEWNVLAADNIRTYHPVIPVVPTNQNAVSIMPNIALVGSAPNEITNGTLTANFTSWENPNGVFQNGNGGTISSVGGDGAVGALRSPAFSLDGPKKYLYFDMAGAIQRDKQIFVLVKEVGTNNEVLRLVRRADQSSTGDSGDFKTHWFDLSELPTDKEYYLEAVDNRNGGWGVIILRNVSLSASTNEAYRLAINANYGLAAVDPVDGDHRQPQNSIVSLPDTDVFWPTETFGEDASTRVHLSFHSRSEFVVVEYTSSEDRYFENATKLPLTGVSFSSPVSNIDGVRYGFSTRFLFQTELTDLTPSTGYRYRVWEGPDVSSIRAFLTGPAESGPFRFLYLTDTQALSHANAMIARDLLFQATGKYADYAFSLITGDLVERGSASLYWDWLFESGINRLPVLSAPGNHDYYGTSDSFSGGTVHHYNAIFNNPNNGITEFQNSSYFLVYSNVLFVMLDVATNEHNALQTAWLASVIAAHRQDFVVVGMHYSAYGTTHTGTASQILSTWMPFFDANDVDLVLSGHDHVYARTPALVNNAPDASGTIYFIGGTGGHKLYNVPSGNTSFAYYMASTQSTVSIFTVSDASMVIETVNLAGTVVDTFTILKRTTP
jgi:acid phosphatase type 7